jgi:virulence factor Mce-like protein
MQKQAPTFGRLLTMVVFALSCFGLLLFLWLAFGGATPLKPDGYRVTIPFRDAGQLADEADVRISGVSVGKVKTVDADQQTGMSDAVVEIDPAYAPLPSDTRAVLRAKTLLGETYVELTPGTRQARTLAEGARLPVAQVAQTVQLDEILRALDPETRRAFQTWTQTLAVGLDGRGRDLSAAFGELPAFTDDTARLLHVLDAQSEAVSALVRNTGQVAGALTERRGALRTLITRGEQVFATTAERNAALRDAVVALPAFQRETAATVRRLTQTARRADPLVTQLRPAARELSPTLVSLSALAPDLRALFGDLDPLITASKRGLPATRQFLRDLRPFLGGLGPPLDQLIPITDFLGRYPDELTAFFANAAASTQATSSGANGPVHYLRTTNPLNPEALAVWPRRAPTNRTSPYRPPGAFRRLAEGLENFETRQCKDGVPTVLSPAAQALPVAPDVLTFALSDGKAVAPPCVPQTTKYPRVEPRPARRR